MATYVLPQVLVFQDFDILPAAAANPLRAHISGGHAYLVRYEDEDEREFGRLGYYDDAVEECFSWPSRPAGGQIDETYTKLWIKDALLEYFSDALSSASAIIKVAGYNNRIRSATVNFATNGAYSRAASLLDRDVQPGDTVQLRVQPAGSDPVYMWTYVKDLVGDPVNAVIAAASADPENPGTQGASTSVTQIRGAHNCIELTPDGASYNGLLSGHISETYNIKVLASSVNGDLTTALIRVLSGSGEDDILSLSPEPAGDQTAIGTRGLLVTFDTDSGGACSASADDAEVSHDDLIEGQEFQVVVNQAFTKPVATSAGDYEEDDNTTYIVEVVRGGAYADSAKPRISVTTTNGIDLSGPTDVTAAATAIAIGTRGITIAFSGTSLRFGDRYYVEVTGVSEGPMRTIQLGHNIASTVPADSEVGLTLYIRKPLLQVTEQREGFAPEVNWEQSETEICVAAALTAYDESWTDEGVPQPLDIKSSSAQGFGLMYVEYRAWISTLAFEIGAIRDVGELDDLIPGPLHPDNPLKWGVFKALSNSNGTEVKYTSIQDPDDPDDWIDMLEILLGRDDVYGLVPLTRLRTVQDLVAAHVDAQSAPEQGLWRVAWFSLIGLPEIPVVHAGSTISGYLEATTSDEEVALGVFEDDVLTSGSQYTILRVPAGNAEFIENEVRPGDIVRALYVNDGFGEFTYSEFVVDEVQSEDQLRLLTGPAAPQSVPAKFEIWRNLSPTEEATEIAKDAGSWNNRRIRAVWPDVVESGGTLQEGYHLCAALAGLTSGVLPHQGLTRLEVAGFTDLPRTIKKFNRPQLDAMAVAGVWIVTQDLRDGVVFTRHAVTTGDYENVNDREEMVTRNVDSISYRFKDHFEPFIGVSNVTPSMQGRLEFEFRSLVEVLRTERATVQLGGQIINAELVSLRPHLLLKDRYVLNTRVTIPYPFNTFEIHLVV